MIPRWFLGPLSEGLQAAGHRVAYAVLRAPLDVCLARVGQRSGDETLADADVISGIWRQFAALGALEDHVIETAAQPVDAVAWTLSESIDGRLLLA